MSQSPEEKDTNLSEPISSPEIDFEESTIFSAPAEHKDSKKGSKMLRKIKSFQITFEFRNKPSEISSLHLCY